METLENYLLSFLIVLGVFGALYLIIWVLLHLFVKYTKVYVTDDFKERHLIGFLVKSGGQYVLYNKIGLFRTKKGRVNVDGTIQIAKLNENNNYVLVDAGRYDATSSAVFDDSNNNIATCSEVEKNTCSALNASNNEVAFSKGKKKSKELIKLGAAIGVLWKTIYSSDTAYDDVIVGNADMAFPAALIFFLLYPLGMLFKEFSLLGGNSFPFILSMFALYGLIFLILSFVKYDCTMTGKLDSLSIVGMVDRNVGVRGLNIAIIVLSSIALVICLLKTTVGLFFKGVDGYFLIPFFAVLIFSLVLNSRCFEEGWKLVEPSDSWGRRWRRRRRDGASSGSGSPSGSSGTTSGKKRTTITFLWDDILQGKGIPEANEQVSVELYEDDFNDPNSADYVRKLNPFNQKQPTSESDLCQMAKDVMNGIPTQDNLEAEAITTIVDSAGQLCQKYNLADYELYDLLLQFCQKNINYVVDDESEPIEKIKEYFRFAGESLFDQEGDCDCKSVLACKLMEELGVNVNLVSLHVGDDSDLGLNHAAVVLVKSPGDKVPLPPDYTEYEPGKVYCEATGAGYPPGVVPPDAKVETITVIC